MANVDWNQYPKFTPYYGHCINTSDDGDGLVWEEVSDGYSIFHDAKITKQPITSILDSLDMDFKSTINKAQRIVSDYIKAESPDYDTVIQEFKETLGSIHKYFNTQFLCLQPSRKIVPAFRLLIEQIVYELGLKYRNDTKGTNDKIDRDIMKYLYYIVKKTHNGDDHDEDDYILTEKYRSKILIRVTNSTAPIDSLQRINDNLFILKTLLMIFPKLTEASYDLYNAAIETYYNQVGKELAFYLKETMTPIVYNPVDTDMVAIIKKQLESDPSDEDMYYIHGIIEKGIDTNVTKTLPIYTVATFEQILFLYYMVILKNRRLVRMCPNCNRFFIAEKANVIYCDRLYNDRGKRCCDTNIGAKNKNKNANKFDPFRKKVAETNSMFNEIRKELESTDSEFDKKHKEWEIWQKDNKEIINSYFDYRVRDYTKFEQELDHYYRYAFRRKVRYIDFFNNSNENHIEKIEVVFNSVYYSDCEYIKSLSKKWNDFRTKYELTIISYKNNKEYNETFEDDIVDYYTNALWIEKHCEKKKNTAL